MDRTDRDCHAGRHVGGPGVVAIVVTPSATERELAQRRHVLFTMLTTLAFRYPPGREPPLIGGLRSRYWYDMGGWEALQ